MKKHNLILAFASILSFGAYSQTIPNAGFENWTVQGPSETPNGWVANPSVIKSTDMQMGIYAIQLEASDFFNPQTQTTIPLPGRAVCGTPGASMGDPAIEGFAFTERPDSLTGWYKYLPNGVDTCIINVTLSVWNTVTNSRDTITNGSFSSESATDYTYFSSALQYNSLDIPDTCIIELLSSKVTSGIQGSVLLIDDLEFYTSYVGINSVTLNQTLTSFPNPFSTTFEIKNLTEIQNINSINVYNSIGKVVTTYEINTQIFDFSNLQNGVYFIKIKAENDVRVLKVLKE